jgi:hypothetical protein
MNFNIHAETIETIATPQGDTILIVKDGYALTSYQWLGGGWEPVQFGVPVIMGSKKEAETGERVV